ncbi:MAG: rRNA cytosine-C5-methyltransferase [Bacteroidales bacterium]|nr:rRNA cytosine-C5-methyltransferase [Bacteroidales bacterium]
MAKHLPISFIEQMKPRLQSEYALFEASLFSEPPVSVRLNTSKIHTENNTLLRVPWCNVGRYLSHRPIFTLDPLFHAGAYYVQEASSMFLQTIVEQYVPHDAIALDLCAAPGGKSIILSDWLNNGLLVSNEIIPSRCAVLVENLMKWGNERNVITNSAPRQFENCPELFDVILTDVPCSGEGMFRKDDTAIAEWSESNVAQCVSRGREILTSALVALRNEGILIYSTCTFNEQEDEQQVQWLIEQGCELLAVNVDTSWQIETTNGYHFWPHRVKGEGLFMAVLKKNGKVNALNNGSKLKTKKTIFSKPNKEIIPYLIDRDEFAYACHNQIWRAIPQKYADIVEHLLQCTKVVYWGVSLVENKGAKMIPQQSLALNRQLNKRSFCICEITDIDALNYLSGNTLVLPSSVAKGIVLLTYCNVPIGFVNNLGTRCNNLYPNNWRIRMSWTAPEHVLMP